MRRSALIVCDDVTSVHVAIAGCTGHDAGARDHDKQYGGRSSMLGNLLLRLDPKHYDAGVAESWMSLVAGRAALAVTAAAATSGA
jgi:hypothetical protein